MADKELNFQPDAEHPDADLRVSRSEVASFLQLPLEPTGTISRLRQMITQQRWGWSGGDLADEWYVQIDRSIHRFAHVRTFDDYLAVMREWDDEGKRPHATIPDSFFAPAANVSGTYAPSHDPKPYVPAVITDEIEKAAAQSAWDCTKLLTLIGELNDSYAAGKTYSAHALLRAILDHVPPLLGQPDFAAVVNCYPWGRTDKQYLKRLVEFRSQADDVLHRQISRTADLISIEDMPQRTGVGRLLQECAKALAAGSQIVATSGSSLGSVEPASR